MPRTWKIAVPAGLLAGALDILYAISVWAPRGVPPSRVLQSVASGVLGRAAFTGGTGAAALGLGLHLAIALAMATAWVYVARRRPLLLERPWTCGAAYGLLLHLLMNYVVVPLSAAPLSPPKGVGWWIALLPHVLLVAWPIAWLTRRALRRPVEPPAAVPLEVRARP